MDVHRDARACPCPVAGRSLRACDCRAVAAVPASAPAYGRRARPGSQHPALRSLDASSASPSWLRVGSNAGSRGTGSPSLPLRGKAVAEGQRLIWLPHTMAPFYAPPPARMAGSPTDCNGHDGVATVKRRARDSNPQPISRHLISSQTASRSLTLRCLITGSRFGRPRRLIFPGRNRDSWTITVVAFVPQVPGRAGITRAESIRRNRKRMASAGPPSVRSPVSTQPRGSRPESKATDKT